MTFYAISHLLQSDFIVIAHEKIGVLSIFTYFFQELIMIKMYIVNQHRILF